MSVTEDVELPRQPTTGGTFQQPLGGDGFVAPIHRTDVDMTLTGDASGGIIRHRFILDKRHSYLLNLMSITATDPAADTDHIITLGLREGIQHGRTITGDYISWSSVPRSRALWEPPSLFFPGGPDPSSNEPYIQVSTQNVNTLEVKVTLQLLGFDIEAIRNVPYGVLVSNKPF